MAADLKGSDTSQTAHRAIGHVLPAGIVCRTPAGTEAVLRGTADNAGRTAPALLVLGCPTVAISPMRPAQMPFAELRVPKSSVPFDVLFVTEKDGNDNGYVHLQVNTSPEIKADLAAWTLIPESGDVAPLGLDLNNKAWGQITSASGAPLRVEPETGVSAHFTLPADPSPAQSAMEPCLQKAKAAEAALHASRSLLK